MGVRRQAWEDALTGLGHPHKLQARACGILETCRMHGSPLGLAYPIGSWAEVSIRPANPAKDRL